MPRSAAPSTASTFANAHYQHLVGDRAIAGQAVAEALPEVIEQGVSELLDRVYQTGEPFIGREVIIMLEQPPAPPHQYHYDLTTYSPLRDGHGQVQGLLVVCCRRNRAGAQPPPDMTLQAEVPAAELALAPVVAGVLADLAPVIRETGAALHVHVPAELHLSFAPLGVGTTLTVTFPA